MSVKIKNISISGIRGIKGELSLPLSEKSILIYGDNGTGKSSISDALEWYFTERVNHLASQEIDLKDALRNSSVSNDVQSRIQIDFSNLKYNSEKKLFQKKEKLFAEDSNSTEDFKNYIDRTSRENLILRYQYLTDFIDKTKGDKLKSLSDIIGFSEVNKTKEVLKKAFSSIKSEIKSQNFENQINTQKETLKAKIGAVVSVENNLYDEINRIIKPFKLDQEVRSLDDIDEVLLKLKSPSTNPLLTELKFLESNKNVLNTLKNEAEYISNEYSKYYVEFNKMADDVESIMQIFTKEILNAGKAVIHKKFHKENTCPLCLQAKDLAELLIDIDKRLALIEESAKKKATFDSAQQTVIKISEERIRILDNLKRDSLINDVSNSSLKFSLEALLSKISVYQQLGKEKVTSGNKLKIANDIKLLEQDFSILLDLEKRIVAINKKLETDNKTTIYSNISSAKEAFLRIKKFESDKLVLDKQRDSLQLINEEFVKKQKEALENFISQFSGTINDYYQYMNPAEQFDEIKIVTKGDEDDLTGITIEYKYNGEWVSPPQKYFSESHLNCFGIAFFLASVKAFNVENKFILLDDVISSFDTTHRKRFADLLIEKFSDYQIILLTHEIHWYQYVSAVVKNKNWLVNSVKWTELKGTFFEESSGSLKLKIEDKFVNSNIDKLGNDIREYLERILKEVALNFEVKMKFQFNEKNEDRMSYELLSELKGRISKSADLKSYSHDSKFSPSLGDLKAFWADVKAIEILFFCDNCQRGVQFKYYDESSRKIKCKCGTISYDLKR
jgi:hypothetical protein